jgi:hypothetical protein
MPQRQPQAKRLHISYNANSRDISASALCSPVSRHKTKEAATHFLGLSAKILVDLCMRYCVNLSLQSTGILLCFAINLVQHCNIVRTHDHESRCISGRTRPHTLVSVGTGCVSDEESQDLYAWEDPRRRSSDQQTVYKFTPRAPPDNPHNQHQTCVPAYLNG